jgi:hypothetical protein
LHVQNFHKQSQVSHKGICFHLLSVFIQQSFLTNGKQQNSANTDGYSNAYASGNASVKLQMP